LVVLDQGKEAGEHETGGGEELIVVLQGKAEVIGQGEARTVRAPPVVLISAHTKHDVKNTSKAPPRYVYSYVMAMDGS
jgi:quercetin dioxygenase-like cupin family protein